MKKLAVSIVALVLSLCVFGAALYAWFSDGQMYSNITFETNGVEMTASVFVADDFNRDGYIDEENAFNAISGAQFSTQSYLPGSVYTYRLDVANTSSQAANLTVYLKDFPDPLHKYLAYRSGAELDAATAAAYALATDDAGFDLTANNKLQMITATVPAATAAAEGETPVMTPGTVSVYFQLYFLPYTGTMTGADYDAYQALKNASGSVQLLIAATPAE